VKPVAIRIWRAPVALAAATASGIVAALFVDGAADAAGWVPLAIPLAVVSRFVSGNGLIKKRK
jgi:hypothetical protein